MHICKGVSSKSIHRLVNTIFNCILFDISLSVHSYKFQYASHLHISVYVYALVNICSAGRKRWEFQVPNMQNRATFTRRVNSLLKYSPLNSINCLKICLVPFLPLCLVQCNKFLCEDFYPSWNMRQDRTNISQQRHHPERGSAYSTNCSILLPLKPFGIKSSSVPFISKRYL